jgi:hypothetical protein
MLDKDYRTKMKKVEELLTEVSKEAEKGSGFVKRRSKMDGRHFVRTMVLGCLQKPEMSLSELAQISMQLGVEISGPGLDQRIDKEAVQILKQVLQEGLERLGGVERLEIGILKKFSKVYLTDSTQMELPAGLAEDFPGSGGDASPAALKLQVMFEYLSSTFEAIEVGPANQVDQGCRIHLQHSQPDALHLFDLGYFNQRVLAELDQAGAYFITRLNHDTAMFSQNQPALRLELLPLLRNLCGDQLEVPIQLGCKAHLPVRVLFQRMPAQIVAERRRKAIERMKKKGRSPTQEYLELLEWNSFVTNVPQDWLCLDQALLLYTLRWQIELVFKLWKSQAGLDAIGPWRKERVLVQLYARLIGLALFFALSAPFRWQMNRELSLPKAFTSFQACLPDLIRAITHGWKSFPAVLKRLISHWKRFDLKTQRCKDPSTFHLLCCAA